MPRSVATGISQLPQELIDKIIDHVFYSFKLDEWTDSTLPQLRNCAIVSRAFRERCQKHLFTCIRFPMEEFGHNSLEMFTSLKHVFSMNPQLSSHVRILTLEIISRNDPWNLCFTDPNFISCMTHISQSGITDQFKLSPNLQLSLGSTRILRTMLAYERRRITAFETRFIPLVGLRITTLDLYNLFDVSITLFDSCRNLNTLRVYKISLVRFDESRRVPIKDRPLIRELCVAFSENLICRAGLRLDSLSKVAFRGNMKLGRGDMTTVRHILNANLSSLEYLDFFTTSDNPEVDPHIYPTIGVDFARMPNLRKVQFYAPFRLNATFDPPDGTDPVADLAEVLGTAALEHKLETIHIYFHCVWGDGEEFPPKPQDIFSYLRRANWAALDSSVMRMTSSIQRAFKLSILLEYNIKQPPAPQEVLCTKEEDTLLTNDWGQKCLPQASKSPNFSLDMVTQPNYNPVTLFHDYLRVSARLSSSFS